MFLSKEKEYTLPTKMRAREQTDEINEKISIKELNSIAKRIHRSIKNGKYSCGFIGDITNPTRRQLEELGYDVQTYSASGEYSSVEIQW